MNWFEVRKHLREKYHEITDKINDSELRNLIKNKTFIAGGAIRDLLNDRIPKDYDIYFVDKESAEKFEKLAWASFHRTSIGNFNHPTTKAQFITIVYGPPDEVVQEFDFTINTNYFCGDHLQINNKSKDLFICDKVKYPFNALLRLSKFQEMGYKISQEEMIKLGIKITKMKEITNNMELNEALAGMSTSFNFGPSHFGNSNISVFDDEIPF